MAIDAEPWDVPDGSLAHISPSCGVRGCVRAWATGFAARARPWSGRDATEKPSCDANVSPDATLQATCRERAGRIR